MRDVILLDIDHTIADAFWRDPMIGGSWDEYHAASVDDKPIADVVDMVVALDKAGFTIIGLTARPEKWRKLTMDWLISHQVPMDELWMRDPSDFSPSKIMKPALALANFGGHYGLTQKVAFIIDDREDVCAAFRGLGVTALQTYARRGQ
jgi:hypothetical protein